MEREIIEYGRFGEIQKKVKIDAKDKKILALLSEDSRMPLSTIARNVRLSRDTVDYRIKRMQKLGVILKFVPIIDLTRFGFETYHIVMVLNESNVEGRTKFVEFLKTHPNTKSIMEYSSRWDLEWVLVARNIKEFDELMSEITNKFPDVITEKSGIEIIKGYKSIYLPDKFYDDVGFKYKEKIKKVQEIKLDNKDLLILRLLSENARMSSYELGNKIGLSSDAVIYRIKKMYDADVIRQFSIVANLTYLGYHWYTLAVNLKTLSKESEAKLKEYIKRHPYIMRVVKILGVWNLVISIATDTLNNFHKTVKEFQETFADIISNHQTWIAYKEYVFEILPSIIKIE